MSAFPRKRLSLGIGVTALAILASVLAFAFALTPFGQGEAAAAGMTPFVARYVQNGDGAWMWASLPKADQNVDWSACWASVNVSRVGTARAPQTNLYYDVSQWDPTAVWEDKEGTLRKGACVSTEGGSGVIPNSVYKVMGPAQSLMVDTSKVSGFQLMSGSLGGVISLTWKKTGTYESRNSGSSWYRFPGFSRHQSGTWSNSSATAAGTVVGRAVSAQGDDSGGASVSSSNGVTVCLSANPDACFNEK